MAIKKEESEFAKFPAEQVVDWLGHPVTEHLKARISDALALCADQAVNVCGLAGGYADAHLLKADALSLGVTMKAYAQIRAFIEEAADYVKA